MKQENYIPQEQPMLDGAIIGNLTYYKSQMLNERNLKDGREAAGRALLTADKIYLPYLDKNTIDIVVRLRRNLLAMISLMEMTQQCFDSVKSEIGYLQKLSETEHKKYVKLCDKLRKNSEQAARMRDRRSKK